jgi:UDP-glucose 4-epimerase
MVTAMEKASGRKIPYEVVPRREGDVASVYADPSLAKAELHWEATRGLGLTDSHVWFLRS